MKVTATIQSTLVDDLGYRVNDPVDMVWSSNTDAVGAVACVAQILADHRCDVHTEVLAIRIEL